MSSHEYKENPCLPGEQLVLLGWIQRAIQASPQSMPLLLVLLVQLQVKLKHCQGKLG